MIFFHISSWRWQVKRLQHWLDDVLPAQCPACKHWPQKRTMRWAKHHVVGDVRICADCYSELYGNE